MQIQKVRPTIFQVTLHAYELASLMAAIRWIVEGAKGDMTDEARDQLLKLLKSYDKQVQTEGSSPEPESE